MAPEEPHFLPRQQALAGDIVDLDAHAVGILEQRRIVAGRPMALFGRAHDFRAEFARQLIDRGYVLARARSKAYVMQSWTGLVEVQAAMLLGGAPHRETGPRSDTVEVIVVVVDHMLESHEREQSTVESDTLVEIADRHIDVGDSVDFQLRTPCAGGGFLKMFVTRIQEAIKFEFEGLEKSKRPEDDLMASLKVISADSHMMEPPDLWVERLDNKFKEHAPKVVTQDAGSRPLFVAPGLEPYPISVAFAAGRSGNELREFIGKAGAQDAERYRDPARRIEDQDRDGVSAEVLYTTLGMSLFGLEDAGLQAACFKAYNDWTAEFCSYNPRRFIGMALISLADIELGAQELRRAQKIGLRGAMIWGSAPPDKPFWHPMYDPFWTTAQELEMPSVAPCDHRRSQEPRTQKRPAPAQRIPAADEGAGPADRLHDAIGGCSAVVFRNHHGRCADAVPAPEAGLGGKRLRLDSSFHVSDGPRL